MRYYITDFDSSSEAIDYCKANSLYLYVLHDGDGTFISNGGLCNRWGYLLTSDPIEGMEGEFATMLLKDFYEKYGYENECNHYD